MSERDKMKLCNAWPSLGAFVPTLLYPLDLFPNHVRAEDRANKCPKPLFRIQNESSARTE